MWSSVVDGRTLTFHLVGINNQNFIMQDEQTGTWWQQVSGAAIRGPLVGRHLTLIPVDQLTFATWKAEAPRGRVLRPDDRVARRYARPDWEERMHATPTPAALSSDTRLTLRSLVLGVAYGGAERAYPVEALPKRSVALDDLGTRAIAIVRSPDGRSTRVFDREVNGRRLDLIVQDGPVFRLLDTLTGSEWDFTGRAVAGPLRGEALLRVPFREEYWFDWHAYHPSTDVAHHLFR